MRDIYKTKEQLIDELEDMRQRLSDSKALEREHKQAEEALLEGEKQYRDLVENAYDLIQSVNPDGRFLYVNHTWREALGYGPEEVGKLSLFDIIHPDSQACCMEVFQRVISGEAVHSVEATFVTKDGKELMVEGNVNCKFIDGKPVATRGIFRDITKRKKTERVLRESENKFERLAEQSPNMIFINQKGRVVYANDKCETITRYTKEEFHSPDFDFLSLIMPEDRDLVKASFSKHMAGEQVPPYEFTLLSKDGQRIDVILTTGLIEYEESAAILGILTDITERKRAEEALQESEQRFRAVFDNATDGILLADVETRTFHDGNEAICQMLGYNQEEIKNLGILDIHPQEDLPYVIEQFEQQLRRESTLATDIPMKRKDGSVFYADVSSAQMTLAGRIYSMGIFRDITERKEMERKTQISNRLATVGQMASGIAHEINNPLTGVIGFAHLLLQQEDVPENIKKDLKIIYDGAERVASIVRRLLVFARQQKPEREEIDINETMESTVAMRVYEMEANNIYVTKQLAADLPRTLADRGQLQQVFLNIILNAEIEMKLAHGKGNLVIRTETIENYVRISFEDDGPGITKKDLGRIFDPFFTTREVGEGTGLGLSICHGIVAEHGGRIWAESKLGKGAVFIVELPAVTGGKGLASAEPTHGEVEQAAKPKILVVDDELIIQEFLGEILTEEGYDVDNADNATDALEKLESNRYGVILLDIKMRGMNGIELYEYLQKTAEPMAKRVVFITGDVMGDDTWKFLHQTKVPYLMKPFDTEQLIEKIDSVVRQSV